MKCRTKAQGQEVYVGNSSVQCYQPLKLEEGSAAKWGWGLDQSRTTEGLKCPKKDQSLSCMMTEVLKVLGRAVMRKCRVNQNRIRVEAEGPARSQGLMRARKDQNKGRWQKAWRGGCWFKKYLQAKVSETCWAIRCGVAGCKGQEGTKSDSQISGLVDSWAYGQAISLWGQITPHPNIIFTTTESLSQKTGNLEKVP